MADVIHGYKTGFPVPIAIGSTFDPELAEKITSAAAKEAAAAGVHVAFSPMIDLARDSRWGRCMESTGEDPWLNARMAESLVKGCSKNTRRTNKHPVAFGTTGQESSHSVSNSCLPPVSS